MTDELSLGDVIPGVFVVGYEGAVAGDATPARRAPMLLDERGHRVLVRQLAGRWVTEVGATPFVDTPQAEWTRLPVSARWPARVGSPVVIVGADEARNAEVLGARVAGDEARLFAGWLRDRIAPPQLCAVHTEELGVWYTSRESADELTRAIASVARERQWRAVAEADTSRLLWASWWLQRAGIDVGDQLRAAAGLSLGGDRNACDVLRAMVPTLRRNGAPEALAKAARDLEAEAAPRDARSVVVLEPRAVAGNAFDRSRKNLRHIMPRSAA